VFQQRLYIGRDILGEGKFEKHTEIGLQNPQGRIVLEKLRHT
jgi:hypothetical protein